MVQAAYTSRLLKPAEARLHHKGTPPSSVRAASKARCAQQPQCPPAATPARARQAVRDVLADYFEKKKDRLSHATVAAVLRADGAPAAALPALVGYVAAARSEFLRLEAAPLLLVLLRPARVRPPRRARARACMQHAPPRSASS